MQKFAELLFPGAGFERADGAAIGLREERELRALADEFEQIGGGRFDEARAEKNVVVNIVDTYGERTESELGGVGLEVDSGGIEARGEGENFGHESARKTSIEGSKLRKAGQGGGAKSLTAGSLGMARRRADGKAMGCEQ